VSVDEHTIELAGSPLFYRRAPTAGSGAAEPLYLHGIPTSSDDWPAFLERTGGVAPDLIGFGRTGKGGHLDYSLDGYVRFVEQFLDELGIERVAIVAHQWGAALAPLFAERYPARVTHLVLIDPVPLLEQFRWPPIAERWRRRLLGELIMGSTPKRFVATTLRKGGPWSDERIDELWEQFDQGTQRAILRLTRATPEPLLAQAGADLGQLHIPTLIIWGERDPWLPVALADRYTAQFERATLERIANAGHWPWLEQPTVIDRVATFLSTQP
jgi:pimeloyl-ACP methyl ester carboxylesterase